MIPTDELIWVSIQPLIRLFLCVAAGFVMAKAGFLPAAATRGTGQVILDRPGLQFVQGPLILIALLYEAIGIGISWIIKQIFWVPHRFRYGILAAGGWANVGDLPTSVIMSLTAVEPFHGTSDQNLSVAYISIFVLVYSITLFPLGGINLVAMDFQGPDVTDEEVQERLNTRQKHFCSVLQRAVVSLRGLFNRPSRPRVREGNYDGDCERAEPQITAQYLHDDPILTSPTIVEHASDTAETKIEAAAPFRHRVARVMYSFLQTLLMPCSLSIIVGFVVSIVPVLKALFVPDVPGQKMHPAPDGQPPLAVILNTATFIGNASIPLGLMTLGSALAKLEVPGRRLRSLPLGAIGALAIGRMVVLPIFGVLITQGLTRARLLDAKDNVLRFVCIFLSCLPTSTTQVFLTQAYSETGNAQHLSVFLIPQYILMFVMMTASTAYALHLLFG